MKLSKIIFPIIILIMLFPHYCFSLEAIPDEDLDNISAQAGVDFVLFGRDTNIEVDIDGFSWGDNDGFNGSPAGALAIEGQWHYYARIPANTKISLDMSHKYGLVISGLDKIDFNLPSLLMYGIPFPILAASGLLLAPEMRFMIVDGDKFVSSTDLSAGASQHTLGFLSFNNLDINWQLSNTLGIGPHH